jgi:uncharacterized repeat protein (TIGR01451 family)
MIMKLTGITLLLSLTFTTQAQVNSARSGFVSDNKMPVTLVNEANGTSDGEGFEDINNLPGWMMDNQSSPVGSSGWFQGNEVVFNAQSGANISYIAANFNNTAGTDICNWLIMPDLGFLQTLSFWSRTTTAATFADRLLVLHSPTGGTKTGDCTNDFGDFTETLIEINPTLAASTYPEDWTQFTSSIDATGRVAFVYFVQDNSTNGNYIGIDNVQWIAGLLQADLELNSSISPTNNLEIGEQVTVSHNVTNNGPRDASDVSVSITIDSGLSYLSNTCSAAVNASNLTWSIGNLANTASTSCDVTLELTDNGQQSYSATAIAAEIEPDASNNSNQFNINGVAQIIPTLNQYGMLLMLLIVLGVAFRQRKVLNELR